MDGSVRANQSSVIVALSAAAVALLFLAGTSQAEASYRACRPQHSAAGSTATKIRAYRISCFAAESAVRGVMRRKLDHCVPNVEGRPYYRSWLLRVDARTSRYGLVAIDAPSRRITFDYRRRSRC